MDSDIKKKLDDLSNSVDSLGSHITDHMAIDRRDRDAVRHELSDLNRRNEKLDNKMESFFEAVSSLKDEMSRTNVNMAVYNTQLEAHMRRTEIAEQRLEKIEDKYLAFETAQKEKEHQHQLRIAKIKSAWSTVVNICIGIVGFAGFVWTVMQILSKLGF